MRTRASVAVVLLALLVVDSRAADSTSFQTPIPPIQANRGAASRSGTTAGSATTDPVARASRPWRRVRLPDPLDANLVRRVLEEVSRRMAEPRCRTVLDHFQDPQGRRLSDRLGDTQMDVQRYLGFIFFVDGNHSDRCSDRIAYTSAGSRVVYLCPGAVEKGWREDPEHLVATFIHEVLHTLGLGEDSPSSAEITRQVRRRCGARDETP